MSHAIHLPQESPQFTLKKRKILTDLSVPSSQYTDLSPKGTVDLALRPLIDEINSCAGFVTTSSCAGRASVFLAGSSRKARPPVQGGEATVASAGGKGGGGRWLYVSHEHFSGEEAGGDERGWKRRCLDNEDGEEGRKGEVCGSWAEVFRLRGEDVEGIDDGDEDEKRLIHFKFEPMILHVLTASLTHAQLLLRSAQTSGFRESGVTNVAILNPAPINPPVSRDSSDMTSDINNPRDVTSQPGPFLAGALPAAPPDPLPIVAIRTAGLSFESLVGVQTGIKRTCIVSEEYLDTLVHVANARFLENQKRIDRFREAFRQRVTITSTDGEGGRTHDLAHDGADASRRGLEPGSEWEDVHLRRERKRAEGLRRQDEVNRAKQLDQENNARRIEGQQKHGEEGGRLEESGEESGDAEADVAAMMGSFGIQ